MVQHFEESAEPAPQSAHVEATSADLPEMLLADKASRSTITPIEIIENIPDDIPVDSLESGLDANLCMSAGDRQIHERVLADARDFAERLIQVRLRKVFEYVRRDNRVEFGGAEPAEVMHTPLMIGFEGRINIERLDHVASPFEDCRVQTLSGSHDQNAPALAEAANVAVHAEGVHEIRPVQ